MRYHLLLRVIAMLTALLLFGWGPPSSQAATSAEINVAWDSAILGRDIQPISSLPDSTPLSDVITDGNQATLDAQLDRIKAEINAACRPDIDLDSASVGDVRTAIAFTSA
jgi:hypothetical protein